MSPKAPSLELLSVHLIRQLIEGQNRIRLEFAGRLGPVASKLDDVVTEQRSTNERLDRLEQAVIGVGRISPLEARVQRLEERWNDPASTICSRQPK